MRNLIRYLFSHYWKYKTQSAGILLCMLIALIFNSFFSLSIKYSIDQIIIEKKYDGLVVLFLFLLCGFVVYLVSQWLKDYWVSRVSVSMQNDIRLTLFEHLQKLPVSYYGRVSKGSLISHFTNDLGSVHTSFLSIVPAVFSILSILVHRFDRFTPLELCCPFSAGHRPFLHSPCIHQSIGGSIERRTENETKCRAGIHPGAFRHIQNGSSL